MLLDFWGTYRDLLKRPVGWIAAAGLIIVGIPVDLALQSAMSDADYWSYTLANEVVGLVVFIPFTWFLIRQIMRDRIEMRRPRYASWFALLVAQSLARTVAVWIGLIAGYIFVPDVMLAIDPLWQEYLLASIFIPLLLGVFVWELALVLGFTQPGFARAHRFIFIERPSMMLVYLAVSMADFAAAYGLAELGAGWPRPWLTVAFSIRYGIVSWVLSLFALALLLELLQRDRPLAEVFE